MSDCIPAGMEAFVAEDDEQFNVIKKVIDLCDYYILIVGERYGSINPNTGISYTEMEYDYAIEKVIPVLVMQKNVDFFNEALCKTNQINELRLFVNKVSGSRMVSMWDDINDLQIKTTTALSKAKETHVRPGWERGNPKYTINQLLEQLTEMRMDYDKIQEMNKKLNSIAESYQTEIDNLNSAFHMDEKFQGNVVVTFDRYISSEISKKFLFFKYNQVTSERNELKKTFQIPKLFFEYASYLIEGEYRYKTKGMISFLKKILDAEYVKETYTYKIEQLFQTFGLIVSKKIGPSYTESTIFELTRKGVLTFQKLLLEYGVQ
jgi:hypothetical protein